ncbi:hypothetical protein PNOK_0327500 [Pyrrhoderma noxium]|uniref:Uncharacterized protein n=1 Tax=Pyrrhoderma noxium TaxID=2282107 RepID=A0A286UM40_9AGAM|nr:hypothetical protein PNOK_0327500 [Pyrrhoderma noxium]
MPRLGLAGVTERSSLEEVQHMMMVRASVLMSWALPSISNSFFILVNSAQPHSPQTAQPINRVDDGPWPPRKHFRRLLLLALRVCLPCNELAPRGPRRPASSKHAVGTPRSPLSPPFAPEIGAPDSRLHPHDINRRRSEFTPDMPLSPVTHHIHHPNTPVCVPSPPFFSLSLISGGIPPWLPLHHIISHGRYTPLHVSAQHGNSAPSPLLRPPPSRFRLYILFEFLRTLLFLSLAHPSRL